MNILNNCQLLNRWHPEVAIRYLPIVKQLKATSLSSGSMLEVGSGWLGIAPYLGKEVVGLDESFKDKRFPLLKQVNGSILKLPFKDNSFEAVICIDVLEHLSREKRQTAVNELLRVAKKQVFIGVPCGEDSLNQDILLDKKYKSIFKKQFHFLKDHLKYRLPEENEIMGLIKKAAEKHNKKITIEVKGNENLKLRKFFMTGWITKNHLIDFIYRKVFLLLIPFFQLFDKPPYYRKLFFVRIKS